MFNFFKKFINKKINFYIIFILIATLTLFKINQIFFSLINILNSKDSYHLDFIQNIIISSALKNNENPFININQLLINYFPFYIETDSALIHPSPHPLFLSVILIPFTYFLNYQNIVLLFTIFILITFYFSIFLYLKYLGINKDKKQLFLLSLFFYFIFLLSPILISEILLGQVNNFILICIVLYLRVKKDVYKGILLFLMFAIKYFSPILWIYLLLKKKYKQLLVAGGLSFVYLLVHFFYFPLKWLFQYFLHDLPKITKLYSLSTLNISLHNIFLYYRINFKEIIINDYNLFVFSPYTYPLYLIILNYLFLLIITIIVFYRQLQNKCEVDAFCKVVLYSIIFSPIAWCQNFISIIPLFFINSCIQIYKEKKINKIFILSSIILFVDWIYIIGGLFHNYLNYEISLAKSIFISSFPLIVMFSIFLDNKPYQIK